VGNTYSRRLGRPFYTTRERHRTRTDLKETADGKLFNKGQLNCHYGCMIE